MHIKRFTDWTKRQLVLVVLVYCLFISFSHIMNFKLSGDEHLYISAATLLGSYSLYEDFSYMQTPYMPYFYNAIFKLFSSDYLLMKARLLNVFIVFIIIVLLYKLFFILSNDRYFAAAVLLLLTYNTVFRDTVPAARNYNLAHLFVLFALYIIVLSEKKLLESSFAYIISGIFIGLSIGTKLTFCFIPLCFLIPIFIKHGLRKQSFRLFSFLVLGLVIGLLPAIYIILTGGIKAAFFNNVGYHLSNALWQTQRGFTRSMTFWGKLYYAREVLSLQSNIIIVALATFIGLYASKNAVKLIDRRSTIFFLIILLTMVSLAMAMINKPMWVSYFFTLIMSLCLLVCILYGFLSNADRRLSLAVCWIIVILLPVFQSGAIIRASIVGMDPHNWTASRVHRAALAMRALIPENARKAPIATLNPIFALEANMPIYKELATGRFAYRIGGLFAKDELKIYKTTSPEEIPSLLDASPPSAVLVGFEKEYLDEPFLRYAKLHGYKEYAGVVEGGSVYVRPLKNDGIAD